MSAQECSICFNEYNFGNRRPVVGTCRHTFCSLCSLKFDGYRCPTCRKDGSFVDPPTSFDLLNRLTEQRHVDVTPQRLEKPTAIQIEGNTNGGFDEGDFRSQTVQPIREGVVSPVSSFSEVPILHDSEVAEPCRHSYNNCKTIGFRVTLLMFSWLIVVSIGTKNIWVGAILFCCLVWVCAICLVTPEN